jgi:hypothetical protein
VINRDIEDSDVPNVTKNITIYFQDGLNSDGPEFLQ